MKGQRGFQTQNDKLKNSRRKKEAVAAGNRYRSNPPAPSPATFRMKLQLDHKTTITITKESSLAFWRQRYPNLTILS